MTCLPWEVVYMYFSQWPGEGVFERINQVLRSQVYVELVKGGTHRSRNGQSVCEDD